MIRRIVQTSFRALSMLLVFPLVMIFRATRSRSLFTGQSQLLSLVPGKFGSYLRVSYYRFTLESCSGHCYIGFGSYLAHPEASIGYGVYIGAYCVIGMAEVLDHATIATGVYILSGKHQHGYKEIGKPIQEQEGRYEKVRIGKNCWIGNGAVVMANLGVQNVVAAGSVVVKDAPDYAVLAGNPATVIRTLDRGKDP